MMTSTKLVLLGTAFEYFWGVPELARESSDRKIPAASESVTTNPTSHSPPRTRVRFFNPFFRIICFVSCTKFFQADGLSCRLATAMPQSANDLKCQFIESLDGLSHYQARRTQVNFGQLEAT